MNGSDFLRATMRSLLNDGHSVASLRGAILDAGGEEHRASEEERERARSAYHHRDDRIQVDTDAAAFRDDAGVWVEAWLWLPDEGDEA